MINSIRALVVLAVISFSTNSLASVWCTMTLTNVSTGGNNSSGCWVNGKVDQSNGDELTLIDLNICGSSDAEANARNFSLAMAASISGKKVQIYATEVASCSEITRYFSKVGKFKLLVN